MYKTQLQLFISLYIIIRHNYTHKSGLKSKLRMARVGFKPLQSLDQKEKSDEFEKVLDEWEIWVR